MAGVQTKIAHNPNNKAKASRNSETAFAFHGNHPHFWKCTLPGSSNLVFCLFFH